MDEIRDIVGRTVMTEDENPLRKLVRTRALGDADPIWELVGRGTSGRSDVSETHDRQLADAEVERWRESS